MRRGLKLATLAAAGGVLLQFGSCFSTLFTAALVSIGLDFVLDNSGLIDIFPDG